ncbi:hypothetical protein [Agromyces sp. NPDC058110]|uniref:hypothetical protein n=1 Tax=Agromyces sp. NPDC058110 TaxID=3346345 RepID=UPI0036DCC514
MTDPSNPEPFFTDPDAPDAEFGEDDFDLRQASTGRDDESERAKAHGSAADEDGPGAPGNAEPMSKSTDGGLDAGDPGVEE